MWLGETSNPAPDVRPPLVSPLWVQYQLDTCATIEEVMANDGRVRIADTVDHYLICDRLGVCAAVEFLEGKTVFHTGDAMPVKALANIAYQKAVASWQAGRLRDNSLDRFGIAADRVTDFQPGDTPSALVYAFEILNQDSEVIRTETFLNLVENADSASKERFIANPLPHSRETLPNHTRSAMNFTAIFILALIPDLRDERIQQETVGAVKLDGIKASLDSQLSS